MERRSVCRDDGTSCPLKEKIDRLYTTVITGNGEGPIKGRVKQLEGDVERMLPILNELKSSSERQEGRDMQRLEDEKKRLEEEKQREDLRIKRQEKTDRSWAWFRQAVVTICAIGMLIIGLLQLNKQIQHGLIKLPISGFSKANEFPYTATTKEPMSADNRPHLR